MASPNTIKIRKAKDKLLLKAQPKLVHASPKGSEPLNLGRNAEKRRIKEQHRKLVESQKAYYG